MHFLKHCLFADSSKKSKLIKYLARYLELNQNFFEKKDFINYAKSHGVTHSYVRNFIKEIEKSMQLFLVYNNNLNTKMFMLSEDL